MLLQLEVLQSNFLSRCQDYENLFAVCGWLTMALVVRCSTEQIVH